MPKFKQKNCSECSAVYQPSGACSKYCSVCKPIFTKLVANAAVKNWSIRTGVYKGVGSGSKLGEQGSNYIHGRTVFRRWARERKLSIGLCEECGKDIKNATHYEWVGHHKDHDPTNNNIDNLKLLCKQCHQIEHQCWKAFEGVTTISKESRADNSPKRTPPL